MPDAASMPDAAATPEVAATDGPRTSPFAGLARTALLEITPDETIGAEGFLVEEHRAAKTHRRVEIPVGSGGLVETIGVDADVLQQHAAFERVGVRRLD